MKLPLILRGGLVSFLSAVALALLTSCAHQRSQSGPQGGDLGWPRSFSNNGVTFTVYQPRLKSWSGLLVQARAVVAAQPDRASQPTYGTVNFSATTFTDKVSRPVTLSNLRHQMIWSG